MAALEPFLLAVERTAGGGAAEENDLLEQLMHKLLPHEYCSACDTRPTRPTILRFFCSKSAETTSVSLTWPMPSGEALCT